MGSMESRGHLDLNTGYLQNTSRHEFLTVAINHTEIIVAMFLVSAVAMPVGIVVNYKLFNNVTNENLTLYSLYAFCIAAGLRPYIELGLEFVLELGGVASFTEFSSSS